MWLGCVHSLYWEQCLSLSMILLECEVIKFMVIMDVIFVQHALIIIIMECYVIWNCWHTCMSKSSIDVLLRKRFDTIGHNDQLVKLWSYSINWMLLRMHWVTLNGYTSKVLPVLSWVPQGSIVGPLLFLMYSNDVNHLSLHLTYTCLLMTLCSKIIEQISYCECLQSDLKLLINGQLHGTDIVMLTNQVQISSPLSYHLSNKILNMFTTKKLGVTSASMFSWSLHISNILSKAYVSRSHNKNSSTI